MEIRFSVVILRNNHHLSSPFLQPRDEFVAEKNWFFLVRRLCRGEQISFKPARIQGCFASNAVISCYHSCEGWKKEKGRWEKSFQLFSLIIFFFTNNACAQCSRYLEHEMQNEDGKGGKERLLERYIVLKWLEHICRPKMEAIVIEHNE